MGHSGKGPVGSSDGPRESLGRMEYQECEYRIPETDLFNIQRALQLAVSYMPHIETPVEQFQKTHRMDFEHMKQTLERVSAIANT